MQVEEIQVGRTYKGKARSRGGPKKVLAFVPMLVNGVWSELEMVRVQTLIGEAEYDTAYFARWAQSVIPEEAGND